MAAYHVGLVLAVAIAAWEGERHQPVETFLPYVSGGAGPWHWRAYCQDSLRRTQRPA